MYSLKEILGMFDLTYNIGVEDMKRAKKIVLMTHPDKSGLDSKYFLFYKKAFDIVIGFYEQQQKENREVPTEEQNRQLNWIVINRLTPIKRKYDLELVDSIKTELRQSYNKAVNEYNNLLVKFKNSSTIFRQL